MSTENSVSRFKAKYENDSGVLGIYQSEIMGNSEIVVEYVSDEDWVRIKNETGGVWEGLSLHFVGPIYGTGQLNPDIEKKILALYDDPENFHFAFPNKQKIVSDLYAEAKRDGLIRWNNLDEAGRRKFLSGYIAAKRKVNSRFANCGDKFLLPD